MRNTKQQQLVCDDAFVCNVCTWLYLHEIQPKESKRPCCKVNTNCNMLCKDQMDHTVREGASGLVQSDQEYLYQFLEFQLGSLNVCDHIRSKSSYDKSYFLLGGSCHFTSNSLTCFFFSFGYYMILEFCVRDSVNLCLVVQNNSQQNCFFQGILRVSNSSVPFTRPMYMHAPRPIWHP